jgi:hypothetical protein
MSEFNDHKLFELSKKAAEDFQDTSLIPTWDKMEQQLDMELPVKKKRRRIIFLWMLFSVFTGAIVYFSANDWYFVKSDSVTQPKLPSATRRSDEVDRSNVQKPAESVVDQNTPNSSSHLLQKNKPKLAVLFRRNGSENKLFPKYSDENDPRKNIVSKNEPLLPAPLLTSQIFEKDKIEIQGKTENRLIESANIVVQQNPVTDKTFNSNIKEENNILNPNIETKISLAIIDSGVDSGVNLRISTSKLQKQRNRNGRFSIAATTGANINNVKFNQTSRLGLDYGLLLGYRIMPNIELRAGLIMSKKYFNANGKVISFDSAKLNLPPYSSINLQHASGYCHFIEIPVTLLYNFLPKKKTGFYAGTGLSISKMGMEDIDYTFLIDAGTVVERTHAGLYHNKSSSFSYLTSNFFIGIKRRLTQNWSIAAEPYIKFPVTRVNESNLKLTTIGASLIFTFNTDLRNGNE